MRELVKEMELESGCYRVLWLIPSEQRSVLIGPQGRQVQQIKTETGLQTLLLTREAETEVYFGEAYAQVHLAGKPDTTRRALAAIDSLVGGRLAEDGFEELLRASEAALRVCPQGLTFQCLTELPEIKEAMARPWVLRQAVGLRTLLEVLCQWPECFAIQRTGPRGATVAATDRFLSNRVVDHGDTE